MARLMVSFVVTALTLVISDRAIGAINGPVIKPVNAMAVTAGLSEAGTHLRPGFVGRYRNAEFSISISINRQGLRGPDIERAKPPGTVRILALGDSFTFGQGVEYESAWPNVVQQSLGEGFEVINGGWAAASPFGYERYIEAHALAFSPDVVLVAVFPGNDVVDDLVERHAGPRQLDQIEYASQYQSNLRLRVGVVGALREFVDTFLPNLYELATVAVVKAQYALGSHRSHFDYMLAVDETDEIRDGWIDTLRTLDRIGHAVESRGTRFGIVIIPFYDQVAGTEYGPGFEKDRPQRHLGGHCAAQDLRCLDLLPVLRAAGEPEGLYYLKDGHWTARGHEVVSKAIVEWLASERLIPRGGVLD